MRLTFNVRRGHCREGVLISTTCFLLDDPDNRRARDCINDGGWVTAGGDGGDESEAASESVAFSVVLGGGGWAAEARRENNPLRDFDGAFVVVVVVGVGEETILVMGVDEDVPSREGDCGVPGSEFVRDRVLPLVFGREPKLWQVSKRYEKDGGYPVKNVHLRSNRCPSSRTAQQEECEWRVW